MSGGQLARCSKVFARIGLLFVAIDWAIIDGLEQHHDEQMLLQTDMTLTSGGGPISDNTISGAHVHFDHARRYGNLRKIWTWLCSCEDEAEKGNERFHRHFISVALVMLCILPWNGTKQKWFSDTKDSQRGFSTQSMNVGSRVLNASHHPCYLSVLVLWIKHYWFQRSFLGSDALIMLAGFMLDFEGPSEQQERSMYHKFMPERFRRLYPFYALYVILYSLCLPHLGELCSLCWQSASESGQPPRSLGFVARLISAAFGIHLLVPVFTAQTRSHEQKNSLVLSAASVALVLLPVTLTSKRRSLWTFGDAAPLQKGMDLRAAHGPSPPDFSHESLLAGLVTYLLGIVFARIFLAVQLGNLAPFVGYDSVLLTETDCNGKLAEAEPRALPSTQQPGGKRACMPSRHRQTRHAQHALKHDDLLRWPKPLRNECAKTDYAKRP